MLASGTPPTRVLTVNNPQLAASKIAMQNASVKELLEDQNWSRDGTCSGKNEISQIKKQTYKPRLLISEAYNHIYESVYNMQTCLGIYGQTPKQSVHEHVVLHQAFRLYPGENVFLSFPLAARVLAHLLQQ